MVLHGHSRQQGRLGLVSREVFALEPDPRDQAGYEIRLN